MCETKYPLKTDTVYAKGVMNRMCDFPLHLEMW